MPRNTEIGHTFTRHGQRYKIEGDYMYARRNDWTGPLIVMLSLSSHCADCGQEFTCSVVKSQLGKAPLSRRCKLHRDPGRKIVHIHPLAAAEPSQRPPRKVARRPSRAGNRGAPPAVARVPRRPPVSDATLVAIGAAFDADS
jgi:hypothetical protein